MMLRDPWPFALIYIIQGKTYDAFLVSYNRIFEIFPGQIVTFLVHGRNFRDYPPKKAVAIIRLSGRNANVNIFEGKC